MKLALIFVVLACLLVAVSFAEPEVFDSDLRPYPISKRCCENPPGRDGRDGRNGLDGRDGRNGANGLDGSNGANGVDGIPVTPAEYIQVYSLIGVTIAIPGAFPFELTSPVATAGMTHSNAAGSNYYVTVANAGLYLVTFSIRATNGIAVGGIGINSSLPTNPQYLFTIGAGAANYISAYVSLQAGDRVAIYVTSRAVVTVDAGTSGTPTVVMEVASVLLT